MHLRADAAQVEQLRVRLPVAREHRIARRRVRIAPQRLELQLRRAHETVEETIAAALQQRARRLADVKQSRDRDEKKGEEPQTKTVEHCYSDPLK